MNERIRSLAEQAKLGSALLLHHWGTVDALTDSEQNELEQIEKFAQLIVRECIQVGGPEDSYTDDWFKAKADSINKIKQHFGVEE